MADIRSRKTAFITGANRGLGRALAIAFADAGYNLVLHARRRSAEFDELIAELSDKVAVKSLCFDLSDVSELERVISDSCEAGLQVDVLVNNAGIGRWGYFPTMLMGTVRETLEVNLLAPMRITQLLLNDMMLRGSGVVINIASIAGIDLSVGNCAYGVSKAALIAFTKSLASECGQFGIRVNAIAPGMIETDMSKSMGDKARKNAIKSSALQRLARPEEIASVAVMIASDGACYLNGQVIRLDGGHS